MSKCVHCYREGKGATHNRRTGRRCPCRNGGKDKREPPLGPKGGNQWCLGSSAEWEARAQNPVLRKVRVPVQKMTSIPTEFAVHGSVRGHNTHTHTHTHTHMQTNTYVCTLVLPSILQNTMTHTYSRFYRVFELGVGAERHQLRGCVRQTVCTGSHQHGLARAVLRVNVHAGVYRGLHQQLCCCVVPV